MEYIIQSETDKLGTCHIDVLPKEYLSVEEMMNYLEKFPLDNVMRKVFDRAIVEYNHHDIVKRETKRRKDNLLFVYSSLGKYPDAERVNQLIHYHPDQTIRNDFDKFVRPYRLIRKTKENLFRNLNVENFSAYTNLLLEIFDSNPNFYLDSEIIDKSSNKISDEKTFDKNMGTGLRINSLEKTLSLLEDKIDVSSIEVSQNNGLWNAEFKYPVEIKYDNSHFLKLLLDSSGKGICEVGAKVSALMEFVERSSIYYGTEIWKNNFESRIKVGRMSELQENGFKVLDPNSISISSIYRDQSISWIDGMNFKGDVVYVPSQFIFFFQNFLPESNFCAPDTKGLGAGNNLGEALLHSLLEIAESDSKNLALDITKPKILNSDLGFSELSNPENFYIRSLENCFGIHVFAASKHDLCFGYGASLDPKIALLRAIGEQNSVEFDGCLESSLNLDKFNFSSYENYSSGNVSDDLCNVLSSVKRNGYSPVFVNLSTKEFEFPVVKTFIPHLSFMGNDSLNPRAYHYFYKKVSNYFKD